MKRSTYDAFIDRRSFTADHFPPGSATMSTAHARVPTGRETRRYSLGEIAEHADCEGVFKSGGGRGIRTPEGLHLSGFQAPTSNLGLLLNTDPAPRAMSSVGNFPTGS